MVVVKPEIKPTNRLVQLICKIERYAGIADHISSNNQNIQFENRDTALQNNALAIICLDQTSPAPLTNPLLAFFKSNSPNLEALPSFLSNEHFNIINSCKNALSKDFEFSENGIQKLFETICSGDDINFNYSLRTNPSTFLSHENQRIFPTVSPFLVPRRLKDLIDWTSEELYSDEINPLFVIGVFHLLFLQLSPFITANHRLALIISWHLLKNSGYDCLTTSNIWPRVLNQSSLYYSTLRHAERSTFSDWSTTQVWLEFFFKTTLESILELSSIQSRKHNEALLSETQKKILEAVRSHGVVNRERIVTETGINLSTIKYNLGLLAQKGHLVREGGGRSTCYRAS